MATAAANKRRQEREKRERMKLLNSPLQKLDFARIIEEARQANLAVYQLFYAHEMASPYNRPNEWKVSFKPDGFHAERGEYLLFASDPALLLEMAKKLGAAIDSGKQKVDSMACCPLAMRSNCVCFASFICEVHGDIHIGTHD